MRALLLVSTLLLPPQPGAPARAVEPRISVRADSDSVIAVAILKDLASAIDEVARRNGYDHDAPVAGWLETPYMAAASSRPDVEVYFTKQAAYAADLSAHMDSIVTAIVQRRLDEAGYPVMQKDEMRAAFLRGFHKSGEKQRAILGSMARQARIALTLHNFLVKIDAHVAPNAKGDGLVFDRPADRRRFDELAIAIDAANEQLVQAAEPAPAPPGDKR